MNKKNISYIVIRFVLVGLSLVEPYCYLLFFDRCIVKQQISQLFPIVLLYSAVFLTRTFFEAVYKRLYNAIFPQIVLKAKAEIMNKYLEIGIADIDAMKAGELRKIIHDDSEKMASLQLKKLDIIFDSLYIAGIAIILLTLNLFMAVICLCVAPLSFLFTKQISKRSDKTYSRLRDMEAEYENFLYTNVQNWHEVKLYNQQEQQMAEFQTRWKSMSKLVVHSHLFWFINRTFISFKDTFLSQMGLYLLGGILVIKGYAEVSVLLVFMNYYATLADKVLSISDTYVKLGEEKTAKERVEQVLNKQVADRNEEIEDVKSITVNKVSFSYGEQGRNILNHIDMQISKGECIGIVGASGCGKSTLLKLMTAINTPGEGDICINGIPIADMKQDCLYSKIGIIMQKPILFNLTIRENLLLANPKATEEVLWEACERAGILEFVKGLEQKLDTKIGENGIRLSGGQRQRIIIARTLLQDPEVLIFDEATSSLDSENESLILSELIKLMAKKTLIIIAHNKRTIENCNRIYYMQNGEITAQGSHQELMKMVAYRELWG